MEILKKAVEADKKALSEYESKKVLAEYGIPITRELTIGNMDELSRAVEEIGYPVVLKGNSPEIAHKTETGLIKIDIRNKDEAKEAFIEITNKMDGTVKEVLVQEMVKGQRELVVGMTCDDQFGPCVMFGLGGIFTEVLRDVAFKIAPLTRNGAMALMGEIKAAKILDAVRGMDAVDREVLADILIAVGQIGLDHPQVKEIDINPLKIRKGKPIAVDALVVLKAGETT
jgi:acyl-CoA synthetase (NDP forming)